MVKKKKQNIKENQESFEQRDPSSDELLDLTPEEIEGILEKMLALQTEAQEYKDNWLRSQADFINYKKRMESNLSKTYEDAAGRIIKQLLPALDDMKRALDNQPEDLVGSDWVKGIELIYQKFQAVFEYEGVAPMKIEGEQFDPNFHEAISQEESPDHESGQIIEEIQTGYMIGDRVLRHALVRVAS